MDAFGAETADIERWNKRFEDFAAWHDEGEPRDAVGLAAVDAALCDPADVEPDDGWNLFGAKVFEHSFVMHFSRWRDAPLLLRPFMRKEPLWAVQLGWAMTAWIVWRVLRGR